MRNIYREEEKFSSLRCKVLASTISHGEDLLTVQISMPILIH